MNLPILLLVKATLLLSAVLVVLSLLRAVNPRWRIALCEACALALLLLPLASLVPFIIEIPLLPAPESSPATAALPSQANEPIALSEVVSSIPKETVELPESLDTSNQPTFATNKPPHTKIILSAIYGLGVSLCVGRYLRCRKKVRALVRTFTEPNARSLVIFNDLLEDFEISTRPRLCVATGETSPFCFGLRRCQVVIPQSFTEADQTETLRMVLRHELSHVANRDLLRTALMHLVAVLLWFHPVIWILRRIHAYAIEELGDRVAAGAEEEREQYRSLLARLALGLQKPAICPPSALGIFGPPQIVSRLRRLEFSVSHAPLGIQARMGCALVLLAMVLLLAASQLSQAEADKSAPPLAWTEGLTESQRISARTMLQEALEALRKNQRPDGSFARASAQEPTTKSESAVTALAGAAFLAHGGANKDSDNHLPMMRCLRSVLDCQSANGWIGSSNESKGSLYHHAISTWFLANMQAHLSGDLKKEVEAAVPKAVAKLIEAQRVPKNAANRGGWRYSPQSQDSDLSCSAWAIRALFAARRSGMNIPDNVLEDALNYIASLQLAGGSFMYTAGSNALPGNVPRAAMGLYCLQLAGQGDSEAANKAAAYILKHSSEPQEHYEYYAIYWSAGALWARGGDEATRYAEWLLEHLENQQRDGKWHSKLGDTLGTLFGVLAYAPSELTSVQAPVPHNDAIVLPDFVGLLGDYEPDHKGDFREPLDEKEIRKLAANPRRDRFLFKILICRAAATKDKRFRFLLDQKGLRDDSWIDIALNAYDYAINDNKDALQTILDQHSKEEPGSDTDSVLVLSFLDEWELSIPAVVKHFERGTDGAGGLSQVSFWQTRQFYYSETLQQLVKQLREQKPPLNIKDRR